MLPDYYEILKIEKSASKAEVRQAYRHLAKQYHPDLNPGNKQAEENFKLINEAYKILSDEYKKAFYDLSMLYDAQGSPAPRENYPNNSYGRQRRYQPVYKKDKVVYSKKAYFQAFLLLGGLVIFAFIATILMNKYSSYYYYKEATKYAENGQYYSALSNLDHAITDFGSKNSEASILASEILIHKFQQYDEALGYIKTGFGFASLPGEKAQLFYLKGLCFKNKKQYKDAYHQYKLSLNYAPSFDSIFYEMGEMNTYVFKNYADAIKNFNTLLAINKGFSDAYFGRAYCYQQLGEHEKAIHDFERFIQLNDSEGMAYYLKSLSEIQLQQKEAACKDLWMAAERGISVANDLIFVYCPPKKTL